MTKRRPSSTYADGAADIARRFGITIKTLRHYEDAGLIAPVRDRQGWRSYGQAECERLHLILLLRRFGLSLARIGTILTDGAPDISAVIAMQERALLDQKARIDDALALLARARAQAEAGASVDPASLAQLARTEPLRWRWSAELDVFAARFLDPQQRRRLADSAPALGPRWGEILAELERLGAAAAPDSLEGRALGAKAAALITLMTGGDSSFGEALTQFWTKGFSSPFHAAKLPLNEDQWRFLGAAMRAHLEGKAR